MFLRRLLSSAFFVALAGNSAISLAAQPVILRHKFAKGDQLVYRAGHEVKQVQTIMDMKINSTTRQELVTSYVVEEIDSDGNAVLVTKAVRRKTTMDGDGGKYEFDSKSSERDTGTEIGTAVTPYLERLTGSEYRIKLTPRGSVVTSMQTLGMSGQLMVNAGGANFAMESSDEHTDTAELLEKLPD
jgi:hypothetical protein